MMAAEKVRRQREGTGVGGRQNPPPLMTDPRAPKALAPPPQAGWAELQYTKLHGQQAPAPRRFEPPAAAAIRVPLSVYTPSLHKSLHSFFSYLVPFTIPVAVSSVRLTRPPPWRPSIPLAMGRISPRATSPLSMPRHHPVPPPALRHMVNGPFLLWLLR